MGMEFSSWEEDKSFALGLSGGDEYDDKALWEHMRDNPSLCTEELSEEDWEKVNKRAEELKNSPL